jgi:dihydroorotate dehydrogenase
VNVDGTVSARNIILLSDERFKNVLNKISLEKAEEEMLKLNIVKYKFKDRPDDEREYIGMIAQEVKKVISDAVDINKSSYVTSNGVITVNDLHSLNYTSIISYLIAAIQKSQNELIELEQILNNL